MLKERVFFREGDISRDQEPWHYLESATLSTARDRATLLSYAPEPNTEKQTVGTNL